MVCVVCTYVWCVWYVRMHGVCGVYRCMVCVVCTDAWCAWCLRIHVCGVCVGMIYVVCA